ncbi:Structural maintenance of chromosomes protein 6A, partial [Mucuna pruriens]
MGESSSRVSPTLQQSTAGIIKRLRLENFMCHSKHETDFGSHVNFITGQNGSGKSAILTALCVAFGCRAKGTQRASTLKDFIKTGARGRFQRAFDDFIFSKRMGRDNKLEGESPGELLSTLERGWNMLNLKLFVENFVMNKKEIQLHVFSLCMEYRIVGQRNGAHVVTQNQRNNVLDFEFREKGLHLEKFSCSMSVGTVFGHSIEIVHYLLLFGPPDEIAKDMFHSGLVRFQWSGHELTHFVDGEADFGSCDGGILKSSNYGSMKRGIRERIRPLFSKFAARDRRDGEGARIRFQRKDPQELRLQTFVSELG